MLGLKLNHVSKRGPWAYSMGYTVSGPGTCADLSGLQLDSCNVQCSGTCQAAAAGVKVRGK